MVFIFFKKRGYAVVEGRAAAILQKIIYHFLQTSYQITVHISFMVLALDLCHILLHWFQLMFASVNKLDVKWYCCFQTYSNLFFCCIRSVYLSCLLLTWFSLRYFSFLWLMIKAMCHLLAVRNKLIKQPIFYVLLILFF